MFVHFLNLWKMMKYSCAKAAVFNEAQNVENQRNLKILKAATTRCLSRREAPKRVVAIREREKYTWDVYFLLEEISCHLVISSE